MEDPNPRSTPVHRPKQPPPRPRPRGILCPYCGSVSTDPKRCQSCGGHFDPLSRQATQNAMGPWFLRDNAQPFRPGCSFETLRELIRRGKVTRETVIRGPTTRQYWSFAGRAPSVANLLGICHNCSAEVSPDDYMCASCGAVFLPETDRQHLGLAPVHLLPGQAPPEVIAAASVPDPRRERQRFTVPRADRSPPAPQAPVAPYHGRRGTSRWVLAAAAVIFLLAGAGIAVAALALWPRLGALLEPPKNTPVVAPRPVPEVRDMHVPADLPPEPTTGESEPPPPSTPVQEPIERDVAPPETGSGAAEPAGPRASTGGDGGRIEHMLSIRRGLAVLP